MDDNEAKTTVKYLRELPNYGRLTHPIRVSIEQLPDGYYADNADLTLYEYGETMDEAIDHFKEAMEEDIHMFQDIDDNELSVALIDLKHSYSKYVTWQKQP